MNLGGNYSEDPVADILACLRQKGVRLWTEGGQLRYRAPRGSLDDRELQSLKAHREGLVARVAHEEGNGPRQAPLTFSQRAHWNRYRLWVQTAIRQIPAAIRLRGRLQVDSLKRALHKLVSRHEALRTRIIVKAGEPWQEVLPHLDLELPIEDLSGLTSALQANEVQRAIEQLIMEPLDIGVGPLFSGRLLKLGEREHVLLLAMEHIISDAFSMGIARYELLELYARAVSEVSEELPAPRVQFPDFARRQREMHASWIAKHGTYWDKCLQEWPRVRFPDDPSVVPGQTGWGSVAIHIDNSLKQELMLWCRSRGTTLVMGVFAAYAVVVLQWCQVTQCAIQYVHDGRNKPGTEKTIGFFASTVYVCAQLRESDRFSDFLGRLIENYYQASVHDDAFYLEAQVPVPEFTRNAAFNWIPQGSQEEMPLLEGSEFELTCGAVPFEHPLVTRLERDAEPALVFYDRVEEATGNLIFPRNRFSSAQMERFAGHVLTCLRAMVGPSHRLLREIPFPGRASDV